MHFHFANPHGRLWPRELSEGDHYAASFRAVKKIDYLGGISIEGTRWSEMMGGLVGSSFGRRYGEDKLGFSASYCRFRSPDCR